MWTKKLITGTKWNKTCSDFHKIGTNIAFKKEIGKVRSDATKI